jgi:hypothetical protein
MNLDKDFKFVLQSNVGRHKRYDHKSLPIIVNFWLDRIEWHYQQRATSNNYVFLIAIKELTYRHPSNVSEEELSLLLLKYSDI